MSPLPSPATTRLLERVRYALRARDGDGLDDTPWLRVRPNGVQITPQEHV